MKCFSSVRIAGRSVALSLLCLSARVSLCNAAAASFLLIQRGGTPERVVGAATHLGAEENGDKQTYDSFRRSLLGGAVASLAGSATPRPSFAGSTPRSRTDGFSVQRSEREWNYILSGAQYNILREGGTEKPYSSILEGEEREGTYVCAGCGTELFASGEKFHSGTGWPSFATSLNGVEVEQVSAVQMSLLGAELRCGTCGGHLGDVFSDGYLYVGTPAFKSGKRYCIDGAALVFKPADPSADDVFGDTPPPQKKGGGLSSFLEPPKISARER
mmetsp:Transcript_44491/g.135615  ORF Transcript_44491/g.135615 Transcript_44491/m.135615 type:complete len:273 (-) Transcript_44491:66-884(-)|eukprot:CAMPEP_0113551662 /NCGR_PEP_ID=MMETSP0015_2-20120614/14644_1 /TAXON_ID=2838 /ORGANISM="Odontella" /LENGTH=272 /DNA_ID=CAMNT_0000452569 /DNA_START=70 /DNA_END=888 /DNA_ORIENTATION=- /assembly_acc=CAM_ASM_000160